MKTLPTSGVLAIAVIGAAIALAAAFAGPGKASASAVATCSTTHDVMPELVWGGVVVELDVDGDHDPPHGVCATAGCVANGGQCGTCTNTILSTSVISTSTGGDGVTRNLVERRFRKQCTCGYNRVRAISLWVVAS